MANRGARWAQLAGPCGALNFPKPGGKSPIRRRVPASLAELAFDDAEQLLDSAVDDSDARPAPPPSSGVPVPKCGLGDYFSFI